MTDLRIAVVGTGSIGTRHIQILEEFAGVVPVAVSERPDRREELRELGYETASHIGSVGRVDGAIIATDTRAHVEDAAAALQAGARAVLVEKPAMPSGGAGELHSVSENLFVGYNLRFSEPLGLVRKWLGRLGRVHAVDATARLFLPSWREGHHYRESYSARAADGGVLRDLSHEIDTVLWLFGRPIGKVMGWLRNLGRLSIEAEESATVRWVAGCDIECVVELDYLTCCPTRRLEAYGSEGRLVWDLVVDKVTFFPKSGRIERMKFPRDEIGKTYIAQDQAFVRLLQGEVHQRLATWAEGLDVIAICDAARASSLTGVPHAVRWFS